MKTGMSNTESPARNFPHKTDAGRGIRRTGKVRNRKISFQARSRGQPDEKRKEVCCYILMLVYASDVIYLLMSPANYANAAYNALFAAKYFFVTVFVRKMSAEHPLYREESSENLQE